MRAVDGFTIPTRYWHTLDDGRVQCDVCPRACKLRDGQRGVCFVRAREDDRVVLTTLRPFERLLRRSGREEAAQPLPARVVGAVVRHRRLQPRLPVLPELGHLQVEGDRHARRRRVARGDRRGGATSSAAASVAFTYNDPSIFLEYAIDVADACHERGIQAVAVTAGYISPSPRAEFYAHMDAANVDLKGFTEDFYRHICGGHLGAVLDTLEYLKHETDVWFETHHPADPRPERPDDELDEMTRWVVEHLGPDVPMHFTAFHPDFKMLDRPPTPPETLVAPARSRTPTACATPTPATCTTPAGRARTARRAASGWSSGTGTGSAHYRLTMTGRTCRSCGEPIAGRFDGPAGSFGPARRPVVLADAIPGRLDERPAPRDAPAGGGGSVLPCRPATRCGGPCADRSPRPYLPRRTAPAPAGARRAPCRLRVLRTHRRQRLRALHRGRSQGHPASRAARSEPSRATARRGAEQRRHLVDATRTGAARHRGADGAAGLSVGRHQRHGPRARAQPRGPAPVPPDGAR